MSTTTNTARLLREAARVIQANASELKAAHTVNGIWSFHDPCDLFAMIHYAKEIKLARQLLAEANRLTI